ncbi:MAG: type II toxin-antitoxin system RelE/ParE family toxin [Coriobacteriaceae bacterium]|nr:type II toxin-antitoxin system RelE/ParE family toxin [Coriobacteriaceae bacterium]
MPKPEILPAAFDDILSIADHRIKTVGPQSARAITDKLLTSISLLETTPLMGPLHQDPVLHDLGFRKLVSGSYICIYRVLDDVPTIYRVFHESRDYTLDFLWEVMR